MAKNYNTINMSLDELKPPVRPDKLCQHSKTDEEWRKLIWEAENESVEEFRKQLLFGTVTATERLLSCIISGELPVKLLGQSSGIMADKYELFRKISEGKAPSDAKDPVVIIQEIKLTLKTIRERQENKRYVPGLQSKWLTGIAGEDEDGEDE